MSTAASIAPSRESNEKYSGMRMSASVEATSVFMRATSRAQTNSCSTPRTSSPSTPTARCRNSSSSPPSMQSSTALVLCTEWMARHADSLLAEQLPFMQRSAIGSYHWGFVNGRSQTHLPWPHLKAAAPEIDPDLWFHDIVGGDGTPYDENEAALLRAMTNR